MLRRCLARRLIAGHAGAARATRRGARPRASMTSSVTGSSSTTYGAQVIEVRAERIALITDIGPRLMLDSPANAGPVDDVTPCGQQRLASSEGFARRRQRGYDLRRVFIREASMSIVV